MSKLTEPKSEKKVFSPEDGFYKRAEYELMIQLIEKGLWKTVNLSKAVHVNVDTITKWKRTPRAQATHSQTILRYISRRRDIEKILSELDIESTPDPQSLNQFNIYTQLSDDRLRQLITSKTRQLGITSNGSGDGEADEKQPS